MKYLLYVLLILYLPISSKDLVVSFGSCIDQDMSQDFWKDILKENPDVFIMLGDNIYKDSEKAAEKRKEYAKVKNHPDFIRLKKKSDILYTWDDHDYGINDSGADYREKELSREIFFEFTDEPKNSDRRKRNGVYDSRILNYGKRKIQVILLDTRYFRSPLKTGWFSFNKSPNYIGNYDPDAALLGREQWEWLEKEIQKPADVRLLISSIQFHNDHHKFEKWGNFPLEKEKFYGLLRKHSVKNFIIISGDRHIGEYHKIQEKGLPLMYELTTSPLNKIMEFKVTEPFHPDRIGDFTQKANFGTVRFRESGKRLEISLELHEIQGETRKIQFSTDDMK